MTTRTAIPLDLGSWISDPGSEIGTEIMPYHLELRDPPSSDLGSALAQYCEMFIRIPIPIIAKSRDDPPKLTKGSGTPAMGRTPVVTPILMIACSTIINVMLPATRLPYR